MTQFQLNFLFTDFQTIFHGQFDGFIRIHYHRFIIEHIHAEHHAIADIQTDQFLEGIFQRLLIDKRHFETVLRFGQIDFHLQHIHFLNQTGCKFILGQEISFFLSLQVGFGQFSALLYLQKIVERAHHAVHQIEVLTFQLFLRLFVIQLSLTHRRTDIVIRVECIQRLFKTDTRVHIHQALGVVDIVRIAQTTGQIDTTIGNQRLIDTQIGVVTQLTHRIIADTGRIFETTDGLGILRQVEIHVDMGLQSGQSSFHIVLHNHFILFQIEHIHTLIAGDSHTLIKIQMIYFG